MTRYSLPAREEHPLGVPLRMNESLESEGYEGLAPPKDDLIFRTNVQTAYNVGHYEQMTDPTAMKLRPCWQHDAVNADLNCRSCAQAIAHEHRQDVDLALLSLLCGGYPAV